MNQIPDAVTLVAVLANTLSQAASTNTESAEFCFQLGMAVASPTLSSSSTLPLLRLQALEVSRG
jgi:hypothetical protein